jgi:hypothetical protein
VGLTGVAAALILLSLGVPTETVVADYGLSDGHNVDARHHLRTLSLRCGHR